MSMGSQRGQLTDTLVLLQVQTNLLRYTAPHRMLFIKAVNDEVAEMDWAAMPHTDTWTCKEHDHTVAQLHNLQVPNVDTLMALLHNMHPQQPLDNHSITVQTQEPVQSAQDTQELDLDSSCHTSSIQALHEWLGAVSCGIHGAWIWMVL
jgi:hypothetical protein